MVAKGAGGVGAVLLTICVLFYVIAVGIENFYTYTQTYGSGATYVLQLGAFQEKYSGTSFLAQGEAGTYNIDSNCHISILGQTADAINSSDCSEFNAFRAFLLMALLISAISLLMLLVGIFSAGPCGVISAGVLSAVAGIFGLISMAIFVDLIQNQNIFSPYVSPFSTGSPTASSGFSASFGLTVVAWILNLFAAGAAIAAR